ncbi:MAG: hypothetical protein JJE18_03240 [Eubacteriaceae bacterium]|nr:hypothetical protein [Eubacteriaceae bacterium]
MINFINVQWFCAADYFLKNLRRLFFLSASFCGTGGTHCGFIPKQAGYCKYLLSGNQ